VDNSVGKLSRRNECSNRARDICSRKGSPRSVRHFEIGRESASSTSTVPQGPRPHERKLRRDDRKETRISSPSADAQARGDQTAGARILSDEVEDRSSHRRGAAPRRDGRPLLPGGDKPKRPSQELQKSAGPIPEGIASRPHLPRPCAFIAATTASPGKNFEISTVQQDDRRAEEPTHFRKA